ncbi:B-cell receptor CD22-like [Xiphophorus hellerii]|uniref:B-cell receptor CD22-like n=1 Tax=Xiphophorus hellerii TaxID=8084 RepID=UPI0013B3D274|nr:B-cell receptor CD22-like [Xiphophorus hellerii]
MSFSAAIRGVIVLLMAADVCGQDGWGVTYSRPSICALKGSTVEMSCNYIYPVIYNNKYIVIVKKSWITKVLNGNYVDLKDDTDYSGRVEYSCTKTSCSLKISNVRQTDSKEYKFRFTTNHPSGKYTGSPGVSLSVTDPQVKVNRVNDPIRIQLTCHTDCQLPHPVSYVWLEDGKANKESNNNLVLSSFNTTHRYQCAIRGHEDVPSPAVYAPQTIVLSVTPSETVEGSKVTLTCSSDANPAANYTWYRGKDNKLLESNKNLTFDSIKSMDSGQYYCTAINKMGQNNSTVNVDVKYAPRSPSVSQSPSGDIVVGSSVTLTCSSDANPAANYTWYKEGEKAQKASGERFNITNIQNEHSGNYYCKVQNKIGHHNTSVSVTVVPGQSKIVVFGTVASILLIMIFLLVFLISRKWRTSTPPPKPGGNPNNIEQNQNSLSKSQEDLQYASVRFLRKQRAPEYENFQPGKTGTADLEEEGEQNVEYASVKFGQR